MDDDLNKYLFIAFLIGIVFIGIDIWISCISGISTLHILSSIGCQLIAGVISIKIFEYFLEKDLDI